ncbi:MAG TPA: phosphatidylglycerophosphatase A, partial [Desulfobulbus sp.]|nr:phosphatidylglycerophosphatase A [Desulfobulbus sp.]
MFIATGGGSGYLPKAPGTWGSLVGVLLWLALGRLRLA